MPQHPPEYTPIDLTGPALAGLARALDDPPGRGPVLAIGVFDGLHLGHGSLLEAGLDMARRRAGPLWVLTFWPHPEEVLRGDGGTQLLLLSTLEEKVRLLGLAGAEKVLVLRFTREAAGMEAEEFVSRVLVAGLAPAGIVVGFNFTFGRGGRGDPALLRRLGQAGGIEVAVHPAVRVDRDVVSSSAVREALARGDVERAGLLLGRPYSLCGPVVLGAGRGWKLGFPTANVAFPAELASPAHGVYVCSVLPASAATLRPDLGVALPGVANIGIRPTFAVPPVAETGAEGGGNVTGGGGVARPTPGLEVHVLAGAPPTYGDEIRVFFHRRLRPERRFAGSGQLAEQIARDRAKAGTFFGLGSLGPSSKSGI